MAARVGHGSEASQRACKLGTEAVLAAPSSAQPYGAAFLLAEKFHWPHAATLGSMPAALALGPGRASLALRGSAAGGRLALELTSTGGTLARGQC